MEAEELLSPAIGAEELKKFMKILHQYKAGKANTDRRIIASENWWKLRNTLEEQKETEIGLDGGFTSRSGWLHNVIVSKHADAMESFPAPTFPAPGGKRPAGGGASEGHCTLYSGAQPV